MEVIYTKKLKIPLLEKKDLPLGYFASLYLVRVELTHKNIPSIELKIEREDYISIVL